MSSSPNEAVLSSQGVGITVTPVGQRPPQQSCGSLVDRRADEPIPPYAGQNG